MSRMVTRPPAARVHLLPQQGPLESSAPALTAVETAYGGPPRRDLGRQTFGAVDQFRAFGGAQAGNFDSRTAFQYTWQDRVQVNPAHEQPKLLFWSGAQPLIRWGLNRRYVRTFMASSPRFQGRWAYVGYIQRHYAERTRMTGVATRLGSTYRYTVPSSGPGPRAIPLGGAP